MAHFRVPYPAGNWIGRDHIYPALGTPSQINTVTGVTDPVLIADQSPYFTRDQTLAVLWRICGWRFVSNFAASLTVDGTIPSPGTELESHLGSCLIDLSAPDPSHVPPNDFFPYTDGNGNPETKFDRRVIDGARRWAVFGNDSNPAFHFIPSGLQPPAGQSLDANTGQVGNASYQVSGDHNGTPYASTFDAAASGANLSFLTGTGTTNGQGSSQASLAIFDPSVAGADKFYPFPAFTSDVGWNIQLLGFSRQARAFVSGPVAAPEASQGFVINFEGFNAYRIRYPVSVTLDPVIAPSLTFSAQGEMLFPPFGFIAPLDVISLAAAAAGTLAITANRFVPFLNSEGLPIFDEASGVQLRSPFS